MSLLHISDVWLIYTLVQHFDRERDTHCDRERDTHYDRETHCDRERETHTVTETDTHTLWQREMYMTETEKDARDWDRETCIWYLPPYVMSIREWLTHVSHSNLNEGDSYGWHDSFIHVTWTCDMTLFFKGVVTWYELICVTWLIRMCDMTYLYV